MSWKSIACVAALGAMAAPALAVPSIAIVDLGGGVGQLQVITTSAGSLGAELSLSLSGATLTGATLSSGSIFDTANPGANPLTGTETTGIQLFDASSLFVSYGSSVAAGAGNYPLLDFTFTGNGTASSTGVVAQNGLLGLTLNAGPTAISTGNIWDFEPDGDVDIIDFGNFADAFNNGAPLPGTGGYGDGEPDGDVDIIDFGNFADAFNASQGGATAIPEPATILLGMIGFACLSVRRSA
ncbi:hypothetical protein Pla108_26720 [Botrimarina colliarenosi]|uniref:Ice-binding protein C-terminal domain-containing protein n=1 Tax=Botrimarina colliarenosi TaxID=2528001 RepID=A0A5C6ABY4_9BACT|nr:PEP-CTERM sorting domain-containing protein [Botrimarina colliarenosi]TWT96897.1 hypothetical protein Pla108_26720 [Botrimarina colliarenosi]